MQRQMQTCRVNLIHRPLRRPLLLRLPEGDEETQYRERRGRPKEEQGGDRTNTAAAGPAGVRPGGETRIPYRAMDGGEIRRLHQRSRRHHRRNRIRRSPKFEHRNEKISAGFASQSDSILGSRAVMIGDRRMTTRVKAKVRSKGKARNRKVRMVATLGFATGARSYRRYIRTHYNHADDPPRQTLFGKSPRKPGPEERSRGPWNIFPDFSYKDWYGG